MATSEFRARQENAFWQRCRSLLEARCIPRHEIPWYEKRAGHVARSRPSGQLALCTADDAERYLRAVKSSWQLRPWQLHQVVDAVAVLCRDALVLPWAQGFPWERWQALPEPPEPQGDLPGTAQAGVAGAAGQSRFDGAL